MYRMHQLSWWHRFDLLMKCYDVLIIVPRVWAFRSISEWFSRFPLGTYTVDLVEFSQIGRVVPMKTSTFSYG